MNIPPIFRDYLVLVVLLSFPFISNSHILNTPMLLPKLQKHLTWQQVVVHYDLKENQNEVLLSFIQKSEEINLRIPLPNNFTQKVKDFHLQLQQFSIIQKSNRIKFIEESYEFYQLLIEPIAERLSGKEEIIIIHKGVLQLMPFEVLLPNKNVKTFLEMNFLIKDFSISYFTSFEDFFQSKKVSVAPKSMLVFAPVFQDNAVAQNRDSGEKPFSFREVSALPHSEIEAQELANLFKKFTGNSANILLHNQAGRANFLNQTQQSFKFIHLATHSFANFENSEKSGIICSGEEEECAAAYEIMYAEELANQRISAELVVLSSCESGIGRLDKKEGVLGIHRSFMKAGCGNVLFSLWKVNDQVCQKFMQTFYQNIFAGKSYSKSLRAAKLDLINSKSTASPNVWAAFLLMGA